jgi:hypothetical protein
MWALWVVRHVATTLYTCGGTDGPSLLATGGGWYGVPRPAVGPLNFTDEIRNNNKQRSRCSLKPNPEIVYTDKWRHGSKTRRVTHQTTPQTTSTMLSLSSRFMVHGWTVRDHRHRCPSENANPTPQTPHRRCKPCVVSVLTGCHIYCQRCGLRQRSGTSDAGCDASERAVGRDVATCGDTRY